MSIKELQDAVDRGCPIRILLQIFNSVSPTYTYIATNTFITLYIASGPFSPISQLNRSLEIRTAIDAIPTDRYHECFEPYIVLNLLYEHLL